MASKDGLQTAQIIADLQSLQNADPAASHALLTALKDPSFQRRKSKTEYPPSPPKFDRLGRRITLPRTDSGNSSGFATPAVEPLDQDEDMSRAKTLLELFEMRGKFKQMGDTGLTRARQRVDEVITKYAAMELDERERAARARHLRVP